MRKNTRHRRTGDELDAMLDMEAAMFPGANPANRLVYKPPASALVPETGAWALITRALPPIEHGLHEHVRVGRVFYIERVGSADEDGFMPDGRYKVLCRCPAGDVHLWPYEYSIVPAQRLTELWADGELVFHATNMEVGRLNETVFYARSRGIGVADALVMALGTLAGPVGWFEPRADLAAECEALAARVHRWPAFPPRKIRKRQATKDKEREA